MIPWTVAHQAPLSSSISRSLLKVMFIELVMLSNHLTLCCPLLLLLQSFPASVSFPMSRLFPSGGQSTGVPASAAVFPVSTQGRFPLGLTSWISLLSKGLSRVFSSTTVQKHHHQTPPAHDPSQGCSSQVSYCSDTLKPKTANVQQILWTDLLSHAHTWARLYNFICSALIHFFQYL